MNAAEVQQQVNACLREGRLRDAITCLDTALQEQPQNPALLQLRAALAWQEGDLYGADDWLRKLETSQGGPTPPTDLMTVQLCLDLLEFDRARSALDRLFASGMPIASYAAPAVRLLVWQGERARALETLRAALDAEPGNPELLSLLVTHDRNISAAELATVTRLTETLPENHPALTRLLFPLARYYDRIGEPDRAWTTMLRANALSASRQRQSCNMEAAAGLKTRLVTRAQTALTLASPSSTPETAGDMSFLYLVGAPRTGSSLVQSILAAHTGVQSAGERGALLPYLNKYCDSGVAALPENFIAEVRQADLAGLKRAGLTAPIVVDKTTHNFFIAPLIAAVHRPSRFLNIVRRPQDVALSMLFHEFPPAFPESLWLDGTIAMLEARRDIATLYRENGFDMKTVNFDAFTQAPSVIGRQIAEWAGLNWQEETLQPERRIAAVPTFSAGQVREPITANPSDRWQRFAPFMSDQQRAAMHELSEFGGAYGHLNVT